MKTLAVGVSEDNNSRRNVKCGSGRTRAALARTRRETSMATFRNRSMLSVSVMAAALLCCVVLADLRAADASPNRAQPKAQLAKARNMLKGADKRHIADSRDPCD